MLHHFSVDALVSFLYGFEFVCACYLLAVVLSLLIVVMHCMLIVLFSVVGCITAWLVD